ncbi:hypothetical protein Vretifemale_19474 [Volvox reticuliferus]|uniref:Ion transport domain-containing protein n=2 Tax=Volvox reticuliferus TaxID=1737510 RepID=A0A8J4CZ44_9CHLO|nr:hypothetical protein Vretifemale_19474 [Volvox reticuliferus]
MYVCNLQDASYLSMFSCIGGVRQPLQQRTNDRPHETTPRNNCGYVAVPVSVEGGSRERPPCEDDFSGFQQRYIQFTREGLVEEPASSLPITFPTRFGAVYSDGSIRIFDMEGVSYTESRQVEMGRDLSIYDIDVSGDGKLLFVAFSCREGEDRGRGLYVYDFESSTLIWQHKMEYWIPTKQHVIPSGDSGLVSYDSSRQVQQWQMKGKVVWSDGYGQVHLIDLSICKVVWTIDTRNHHSGLDICPQVHWELNLVLTRTARGTDAWVCLWDLKEGGLIRKYDKIQRDGICGACFTADGSRCITVSKDRTAALFKLDESGEIIKCFVGHEDDVTFAALSPNEDILATASWDETVRIWDVDTGDQLHVIQYSGEISRIHFLQSSRWIITTNIVGYIIGFDTTGKSPPLIFQGAALEKCVIMKLHPVPPLGTAASGSSLAQQLPLVLTVKRLDDFKPDRVVNVLHLHPLSTRQPLSLTEVWGTVGLVSTFPESIILILSKMFPGLVVVPEQHNDGNNTYLHRAVLHAEVEFLRELLTANHSAIMSAPLPANNKGKTPLDIVLDTLCEDRCAKLVELFLSTELERPPHLRLAARKAAQVIINLTTDRRPISAGPPPYTLLLAAIKAGLPWMKAKENVQPGDECGLPYLATATRVPADSPLGALVHNDLNEALLSTDIGTAILMYKWNAYAGNIFKWRAVYYVLFITLYITSTTLDVSWNPKVDRASIYGNNTKLGHSVPRYILLVCVQSINMYYLWTELSQLIHLGALYYFNGPGSLWNWMELISGILVIVVMVLQITNVQAAYWVMSACTLLLGARVLKALSVFKETGIYVRIIFRITMEIRYFLLIVLVILMTYAFSF